MRGGSVLRSWTSNSPTSRRSGSTGTARWSCSRNGRRCTPMRCRGCRCTSASARGRRSARARRPRTGRWARTRGRAWGCTDAERVARRAEGREPALRVHAGFATVAFDDRVLGRYEGVVDDFVVRRNDGAYAYNLAVVVDDAAQGIEEVVRGADLVDSTPRQLWLARALGVAEPAYAHVPLVLGVDGRRLAKRHGDVTLREVPVRRGRCMDGRVARARWPHGRPRCSRASTPRRSARSRPHTTERLHPPGRAVVALAAARRDAAWRVRRPEAA